MKVPFAKVFAVLNVLVAVILLLSGCSDQNKNNHIAEGVGVVAHAEFHPFGEKYQSGISIQIFAEYANFDKRCSDHVSLIGVVGYPRTLEPLGSESGVAKTIIPTNDENCPLKLMNIQAKVSDSSGRIGVGLASYDRAQESGKEESSCYVFDGGGGYCLQNIKESEEAREKIQDHLIGFITVEWTNN